MKKINLVFLLFFVIFTTNLFSQNTQSKPNTDYWGTFCVVSTTANDTNYFNVDLTQLLTEFEKVYFKNYFQEQDVFSTSILAYNILENKAIIAVPQKYKIEDFRHFVANIKKMTQTAEYNWTVAQKKEYVLTHKNK
jgi:hypothetical protein